MKKLLLLFVLLISAINIKAQFCASNPVNCPVTYNLTTAGFEDYNTFPCVVNNQNYNHTFELFIPNTIVYSGFTVQIDSIAITEIGNLPCGLCWNSSKTSNTFAGNSHNCVAISGLPNDQVGTYKLSLTGVAFTNFGPILGQLDYPGFQVFMRVVDQGASCNPADTTNTQQACKNGTCSTQGVEFVELSQKNTCYALGDNVVVGVNKSFVDYKWIIVNPVNGSRTYFNTTTVSIPYNNVQGIGFHFLGTDSNGCTFSTDTFLNQENLVNSMGLIQVPRICSIDLDTSVVNGQYSITLQSSNFTNHLLDTTIITTEQMFGNFSLVLSTEKVLKGTPFPIIQVPFIDSLALGFEYKSSTCTKTAYGYFGNISETQLYSDANGYPVLSISLPYFSQIYRIDSFEVYRRGNGLDWQFFRRYYNSTQILIGDNAPFSTTMEYMVVCYPNSDCNPNRSNHSNIIFKQSVQVPAALVVNKIETTSIQQIDIYPNPTTNTIELAGEVGDMDIRLLNSIGQKQLLIMKDKKIDLSSCEQGVYYIILSNAAAAKTFKVVKL